MILGCLRRLWQSLARANGTRLGGALPHRAERRPRERKYPDPYSPSPNERYWDGTTWTEQTRGPGAAASQPAVPARPPGWFPDPDGNAEVERYWDGTTWTDHYRPQKKGRGM